MAVPGIRRKRIVEAAMPAAPDIGSMQENVSADRVAIVLIDSAGVRYTFLPTPLDNYDAAVPPTVNDDADDGYSQGSKWYDTTATPAEIYLCVDATVGAAVWELITLTAEDLGTMAVQNANAVAITGGTITGVTVAGYQPEINLAANQFYARSSVGAAANKTISDDALAMVAATDNAAIRASIQLGSLNDVTFNTVQVSAGSVTSCSIQGPSDPNCGVYFPAADQVGFVTAGVERGRIVANRLIWGHSASISIAAQTPPMQNYATGNAGQTWARFSNDSNPPIANFGKSRGTTVGTWTASQIGDGIGEFRWAASDGTDADTIAVRMRAMVDAAVSSDIVPGRWELSTANSSGVLTTGLYIDSLQNSLFGTTTSNGTDRVQVSGSLSATSTVRIGSFTVATLPTAGTIGRIAWVSDLGGGAGWVNDNGTSWGRQDKGGAGTLADADATITVLASAENLQLPTLTANRTITLSATGARAGDVKRIKRTSVAAFTAAIVNGGGGGGTLYTFAVSLADFAEFRFDGTNWYLQNHALI